jgi:Undecaprenyl-phosphate glucose phosphotransferase
VFEVFEGRSWAVLRMVADLVALVAACAVGLAVTPATEGAWVLAGFPPLALVLLRSRGRYVVGVRDLVLDSVAPGVGATSIGAMAISIAWMLATGNLQTVSALVVWTWLAALLGMAIVGVALPVLQRAVRRRHLAETPVLIVGTDPTALDVAMRVRRHPEYGLRLVGFLSEDEPADTTGSAPVLGALDDLEHVVAEHGVRTVIVGYPDECDERLPAFVARCDRLGMQINAVPRLSEVVNYQTRFEYLGTVPLLNLRAIDTKSWPFTVKHTIDRVVASLLLVALSPLMAVIAMAVRLSSPGPVLFRQPRVGRDARRFDLLKFRTMREPADGEGPYELGDGLAPGGVEGDDRRTRTGRLLRRCSLDELPQLINVVLGEMSLVGPRPERPEFAELFDRDVKRYQDRRRVRSGITGWAQVHGSRGQTPLTDRVELDNFYIEHWSHALDLKIILLTIPALLRGS